LCLHIANQSHKNAFIHCRCQPRHSRRHRHSVLMSAVQSYNVTTCVFRREWRQLRPQWQSSGWTRHRRWQRSGTRWQQRSARATCDVSSCQHSQQAQQTTNWSWWTVVAIPTALKMVSTVVGAWWHCCWWAHRLSLCDTCRHSASHQTLLEYMKTTWIDSRLWPTSSLLAYWSLVRTNNDVEGWHNQLNSRCRRGNQDLYKLAPILFKESSYISLQSRLHWCLSHICSGTNGRPISACKGGWRQSGRLTRLDSWQRRHCSASACEYMQWQN